MRSSIDSDAIAAVPLNRVATGTCITEAADLRRRIARYIYTAARVVSDSIVSDLSTGRTLDANTAAVILNDVRTRNSVIRRTGKPDINRRATIDYYSA